VRVGVIEERHAPRSRGVVRSALAERTSAKRWISPVRSNSIRNAVVVRRCFLGSDGLGGLPDWLRSLSSPLQRVLLIDTAAKPMAQAPWVDADSRFLRSLDLDVVHVDVAKDAELAIQLLATVPLVFVAGGYPNHLLHHLRTSGVGPVLRDKVVGGEVAYVGISAGALVAGPDLAPVQGGEDVVDLDRTEALGIVDFVSLCHAGRPGRDEVHRLIEDHHPQFTFARIRDDEAIVVEGDARRIVRSPWPT
jgi:dipeptidase E